MNSLFVKTLFALLLTVVLTFSALILAAALNFQPGQRRSPFGGQVLLQLSEARYAYEKDGKEGLRAALQRFEGVTGVEGVLTDARGRDLLTGEDRSDLARAARGRSYGPMFRRSRAVISRQSDDGQYIYFLMVRQGNWLRWLLQPELHILVLIGLAVVGYFFARSLTYPVRRLQEAVDCFGRGDFRARVRSTRQDELGHLARTFDQMADRIETLLTAERRLLLDISHELRSPLARLNVAIELARSGGDVTPQLDRIQKESDRLNALVGELLQVTRAENDPSQLRQQQVELDELLEGIVEDVSLEAEARGAALTFRKTGPAVVAGDAELLRRAVENVIRNAVRYAPTSSAVEVDLAVNGGKATVSVRDYGSGVPDTDLPHIFDAFYRVGTDRDRASGGAGLGLAIARRAIQLHGGEITAVNSHPGLRVDIVLPNLP